MEFVWAIITGFVVGAIAKFITPGKDPGGFIITTLTGIGGALLATWIGRAAGWYDQASGAGFLASIIGAVTLLLMYRIIRKMFYHPHQGFKRQGPAAMSH
ncbi:MAG TPA: GlsB/YeaQ/YmgE family stress response membrane protein [Chitinispirillaceae bacterium]|nr:GlsB/YeaQ/YmgE family stress response membrane protein [Chitinispirillaceae bacterium]